MIDFEKEKKKAIKRIKQDIKDSKKKATLPKPKKSKSEIAVNNMNYLSARYGGVSSKNYHVDSSKVMNQKAKQSAVYKKYAKGYKGLDKIDKAIAGATVGLTTTLLPIGQAQIEKDMPELKEDGMYKWSKVGGTIGAYAIPYGAASKIIGKGAAKIVGTKAGQKIIANLAKKKAFQTAARKSLTKAGQNATKKAIEHEARKQAGKVAKGLTKGAIADATMGTALNSNAARAEGLEVGSKEWKEYMAKSAAMDFATGGIIEVAPTALKALKKGSGKKKTTRLVNGSEKTFKVDKTYMDFAQERQKNALNKSKKAVDMAQNEYAAAQNKLSKAQKSLQSKSAKRTENLAKLNEMRQKKLAAAEREFKQAGLKLEKKQHAYDNAVKATLPEPRANVRKQAPLPKSFNEAKRAKLKANTDSFMNQVSRVMTGEYNERLPLKVSDTPAILKKYGAKSSKITMPSKNVRKIAYPTKYLGLKNGHNLGFEALEQLPKQISDPVAILDSFTQPNSKVIITNIIDTNNNPVLVALHLNKNGQLSVADEIASMYGKDGFDSFMERARKEGKVLYENKKTGLNDAVTSKLQLSGDATSSDPIFSIYKNAENVNGNKNAAVPDNNNKTLNIVTAYIEKNVDETKKGGRLLDAESIASAPRSHALDAADDLTPNSSIPDSAEKINKVGKVTTIKNPYKGEVPTTSSASSKAYSVPNVSNKEISDIEYLTTHLEKAELKKQLKESFGQSRVVPVKNVQFAGKAYNVKINKNIVGKIVSSKAEKENLALLGRLDEIVSNGKYVGSGEYIPHGSKQKKTVRFDYFETDIRIGDTDYIARFDVEVFPDVNNYKAHEVKEINLEPKTGADIGPEPTAAVSGKGFSSNSIPDSAAKINDEFVASPYRDLGADTYKHSTKDLNAKRYGTDNGVPNATPYGETSQAAKTLYNSDIMDEASKSRLQKDISEGLHAKYTFSNKRAVDNAVRSVAEDINKARNTFDSIMEEGKIATSADIAKGYALADEYIKRGDYESLSSVLADISAMESEAGRTLQAMRIFNQTSPNARVVRIQKQIQALERSRGVSIKIPAERFEDLLNAADNESAMKIQKQIMRDVWNQIPATWTEKANAWRYMCMLANPKTHIRNILGNALFVPVKGMRNIIATGLEKAFVKGERTKAILTHSDKSLIDAGKVDFTEVKDFIMGNSRYIEGVRDPDAKVFNNRVLEWMRRKSGDLLEKEDEVFMGFAYERSYAQYLKSHGIDTIENAGEDILRKAREYATNEALNSTYRDASELADFFSKMKKYANTPLDQVPGETRSAQIINKTASMAVDATIPFTKTPINIMRRGWDYSPGGLIQGMGKILKAGGDNAKLIEGIAKVSSGLTGTGIVGLGLYMGMHDMAQGSLDTMSKEGKYATQNGEQEYSIRIGDYTYSMDWAAPISMPFFIGVELGNSLEKDGFEFVSVLSSMKGITDPIFNLSMLSSLNNVLDTAFSNNSALGVLENVAESYAGQYIPTFLGQIAKTISPEKRTTISTAENTDQKKIETFINRMENKIPFLADTNEPYVDLWGRTEKKNGSGDYLKAVFDNFISPGTLKSTQKSSVDTELYNLGDRLGEMDDIVPGTTGKQEYNKKFEGTTYHMSEHDLTLYKKAKGQYSQQGLQELFATRKYQNMSDDEKKKAIKKVYDAAKDRATMEFLMGNGISKEKYKVAQMGKHQKKAYEKSGMDIDRFETLYKARDNYVDSDGSVTKTMKLIAGGAENYKEANAVFGGELSDHAYRNAKNLYYLGLKPKEIRKIAKGADTNKNKHYSTDELVAYLETTSYSRYEKAYIFQALANWNAHNPYA
ncbi:hypothetical protein ACPW7J_09450 [Ihubacter sp. rT4E-8]|uniref:MuF-C-terminal domain-containing protein n=1 Tax=Ihubacter sp. rT4E-8 TaxID=3242369 RepID=UPI003CF123CD